MQISPKAAFFPIRPACMLLHGELATMLARARYAYNLALDGAIPAFINKRSMSYPKILIK